MPQQQPKSGEFYRHFKDKLYQVLTVAEHSETGESLVIYQALYGEFRTYARPLSMFVSPVDREKYPEVTQTYRFELVSPEALGEPKRELAQKKETETETSASRETEIIPSQERMTALLMDFYDAESYQEKYQVLLAMKDEITDVMIDNMAVTLDVIIPEGDLSKRYEELKTCVKTYQKFEVPKRGL